MAKSEKPFHSEHRLVKLKPARSLTRSNALVAKSPDPDVYLDLPMAPKEAVTSCQTGSGGGGGLQTLDIPPTGLPPPAPASRTSLAAMGRGSNSVSIGSSSSDFLLPVQNSRRRHSDSYFPQKRHHRRHKMRGILHPKYSYSPNPR